MRSSCAMIFVLASVACGGSSTAPLTNSVTGTIHDTHGDRTFNAMDAVVNQQTGSGFAINGPASYVELTDYPGACAVETASVAPSAGQRLVLVLASNDANGKATPPTAAGTYVVYPAAAGPAGGLVADVYYEGGCFKENAQGARSGKVLLTSVSGNGTLEGTFDLTLACSSNCSGGDEHLTGSFHATACSALNANRSFVTCN